MSFLSRLTFAQKTLDVYNRRLRLDVGKEHGQWFLRVDLWSRGFEWVEQVQVTIGSGNVFEDLGLHNPDEHLRKAELGRDLRELARQKKYSTQALARLLMIHSDEAKAIMIGVYTDFSEAKLMEFVEIVKRH